MTVATTRAARHNRIVHLLGRHPVRSQPDLARLLAAEGLVVTQATLSRDLDDLGAVRVRGADGALVYAVPAEGGDRTPRAAADTTTLDARAARVVADLLVSAEASANMVVLRTPPGGASLLASALDAAELPEVLGTVAGDDTVLVISRDPHGGGAVAAALLAMGRLARP